MADQRGGGIAWTDESWNPIRGCSRVSPGCQHCYAEAMAGRFSGPGQPYAGLVERRSSGEPRWSGVIRELQGETLTRPLRWKRPRRVFVNSMSDLFHEALPDAAIDRIFAVMALAPHHQFQVLTKRAERMRRYMENRDWGDAANAITDKFLRHLSGTLYLSGEVVPPLPNVWLGVSCEDQQRADERIPLLLETPAAVRWVSAEPLLGPIDFRAVPGTYPWHCLSDGIDFDRKARRLDWVVVGGESGPGARPCHAAWIRAIVAEGKHAGVPVFVKQVGAGFMAAGDGVIGSAAVLPPDAAPRFYLRTNGKGGDPADWPEDLRVREFPNLHTSAMEAR